MKFTCSNCNELHDIDEISFGADAPVPWTLLSDDERANSELGGEQCVIETDDERHFFVRGCLEVPIKRTDRIFSWGVWVSVSEPSFLELSEHWDDSSRTGLGPYFGWLCTKIPEYPETMFLKTMVHQRPVGERPLIELEPTDHPLSVEQQQGIGLPELQAIVVKVLHS